MAGVGVGSGCDAGEGPKDPVKMKAAHAGGPGQLIQGRRRLRCLDEPACRGDCDCLSVDRCRLIRPAALTGTKARLLGLNAGSMETNVLSAHETYPTGRATVHTGRSDR
jgi:hypothetical protein